MAQLHAASFSTSPSNFATNPPSSRQPRQLQLLGSEEIKILLVENISAGAVDFFKNQGYQVEHHQKAWSEEELLKRIGEFHAIGIRSKTKLTEKVLKAATKVRRCCCALADRARADFTAGPSSPPAAPYRRLLLHWHQSGRPQGGRLGRYRRFQLALFQLALGRRTRHG